MREPITPAEQEILELLAQGKTNKQIAKARGTQLRTIEAQVSTLLSKTGCQRRTELAAKYLRGQL